MVSPGPPASLKNNWPGVFKISYYKCLVYKDFKYIQGIANGGKGFAIAWYFVDIIRMYCIFKIRSFYLSIINTIVV
jgi:hypothetical protein